MSNVDIAHIVDKLPKSSGWDRPGNFSANEVLAAHELGITKGKQQAQDLQTKLYTDLFTTNFQKAHIATEELFETLTKSGIGPVRAYLGIESLSEFNVLIVLDETTYYSDKLDIAYDLAHAKTDKLEDKTFEIRFGYMRLDENIDLNTLRIDGYIASFEPELETGKGQAERGSK